MIDLDPHTSRVSLARRRLQRLRDLEADTAYLDKLITKGRSLRLCAAIAWASETVDRLSAPARLKVLH